MPVSADLIRKGAEELNAQRAQASAAQRSLMGSPVVIVVAGVTIIVSELMLEAGAYTILFAVTVKVVEKAKDDVVDALKRIPITDGDDEKDNCAEFYAACIGNAASKARGNHWNISVCGSCAEVCKHEGAWPSTIPIFGKGNVSCY